MATRTFPVGPVGPVAEKLAGTWRGLKLVLQQLRVPLQLALEGAVPVWVWDDHRFGHG